MKKVFLFLACLLALSSLLPGCGDKEPDDNAMQQRHNQSKKADEGK